MRIVVFSDSHNDFDALHRIVNAQPEADMFVHLGDGQPEFDDLQALYPDKRMMFIRGNCDWDSFAKDEAVLTLGGRRVFLTHGHMYNVKRGQQALLRKAKALESDIACYGHTHRAASTYVDGIHLLNPGSVSFPRGGPPSYGVMDMTEREIAISIVNL